ncbi:MAG: nuclear transport factor 2 family protein [Alphaproteobacteria bacterium]|nr:nuclear transport factor 2 family protein [Alphaproteobacteria bacterium]
MSSYGAAADFALAYIASRAGGDSARLSPLLAPIWHSKHLDEAGTLHAEASPALAPRFPLMAPLLSGLQLCGHRHAVARFDCWPTRNAALLFMLVDADGAWRAVGEATLNGGAAVSQAKFTATSAEREVLEVIGQYYASVASGDQATLQRIFADDWHMKNPDGQVLAVEDKARFIARISPGAHETYADDRQIGDVQVIGGRMAYMRVDKPSTPMTTVFSLFRIGGEWLIADKVWAATV